MPTTASGEDRPGPATGALRRGPLAAPPARGRHPHPARESTGPATGRNALYSCAVSFRALVDYKAQLGVVG